MKKVFILLSILLLTTTLVSCSTPPPSSDTSRAEISLVAVVNSGQIQVQRDGVNSLQIYDSMTNLYPGDTISTTEDDRASLLLAGKSIIRLAQNTQVQVGEDHDSPTTAVLELITGDIWNNTTDHTPLTIQSADITVSTTDQAIFEVAKNNSLTIRVYTGKIQLATPQKNIDLVKNQVITIKDQDIKQQNITSYTKKRKFYQRNTALDSLPTISSLGNITSDTEQVLSRKYPDIAQQIKQRDISKKNKLVPPMFLKSENVQHNTTCEPTIALRGRVESRATKVFINSREAGLTDGIFTLDVDLQEGRNHFIAYITDDAGNKSRKSTTDIKLGGILCQDREPSDDIKLNHPY